MQPLDETLRRRLRILGIDPLLLARALLLAQACGAHVPIIDLARKPVPYLALDLVDLREAALLHFGEMLGHQRRDRVTERTLLNVTGQPRR